MVNSFKEKEPQVVKPPADPLNESFRDQQVI